MHKPIRVGVIGTSWFTETFHLPGLTSHPQAQVVAICGRSQERAATVAKKFNIREIFSDYRQMLERAELDAVLVAAPDDQHYQMATDVLDAGKHLMCEKPVALYASQARVLYDKATASSLMHLVMFTFRWAPEYQYLRQLVESGYLGPLYHCQVRYISQWGLEPAYNWRYDRRRANGVLGDLGSHALDLARLFGGEITRVSARLATYIDRPGPDGKQIDPANDSAVVLLEFASGAQGTLQVSAVAHTGELQTIDVELHGQQGALSAVLPWQHGAQVLGARGAGAPLEPLPVPEALWCETAPTTDYMDRFAALLQKTSIADRLFIDSILSGQLAQPNLYDGWKVQQIVDAAIASHQSGRWEAVG